MAQTPKKLVHWAQDLSFSSFDSPFSDTSSSSSTTTSSIQYINSQLVAHGFTAQPGLCFDGLSKTDSDNAVKCLLSMLGQRVVSCSFTILFVTLFQLLPVRNRATCPGPRTSPPNYARFLMTTTVYYPSNELLPNLQPMQNGRPTCTKHVSRAFGATIC